MSEKDDRRIRYTKRVIRESFVHLLSQKPIAKITVKEICEEADVNRSTFYAHYKDPYDLMLKIKQEVLVEIHSWMNELIPLADGSNACSAMKLVFDYVLANAELCKVMLGEHGDEKLTEEVMMIAQEQVMEEWKAIGKEGAGLSDYFIQFGVHAGIAVVRKWIEKGLREPPGEMAELVIRLIFNGLNSVVPKRHTGP